MKFNLITDSSDRSSVLASELRFGDVISESSRKRLIELLSAGEWTDEIKPVCFISDGQEISFVVRCRVNKVFVSGLILIEGEVASIRRSKSAVEAFDHIAELMRVEIAEHNDPNENDFDLTGH